MDEPKNNNEQVSDSELFDVTVRRGDEKPADEPAPESSLNFEGVEKTGGEPEPVTEPVEEASEEAASEAASAEPSTSEPEKPGAPVVAEPQPAVVAPVAAAPVQNGVTNSGGVLVLQWLSYAFWGWFGAALAVLSGITIGFFLSGNSAAASIGEGLAYPLAAVIVMLVIALVTDFFYARHEPALKTGAANVIMLIHVVLYLLIAVGAVITIVFALISMLLADANVYSDGHNGQKIAMLTAAVVAVTFGALSFRALFGGRKGGVRKLFWLLMSILALVAIVSSIAGPAMKVSATKDDRLIETALPTLASNIQEYVRTNDKLPASLNEVKTTAYMPESTDSVRMMVDKNLVTYKPNSKPAKNSGDTVMPLDATASSKTTTAAQGVSVSRPTSPREFYYQLCVTYKEAKNLEYYSRYTEANSGDYVDSSVSTYSHPKGEVCYDVAASSKYDYSY